MIFAPNHQVLYYQNKRRKNNLLKNQNDAATINYENYNDTNENASIQSNHSGIESDLDDDILTTDPDLEQDAILSSDESSNMSNTTWNRVNGRLRRTSASDYTATTSYASILMNRTIKNINNIKNMQARHSASPVI